MIEMQARDPAVDHPPHYGGEDNVYEVIKILEHYELGFHLGNTVKYILRAGRKNPATFLRDLKKARWYLSRMIEQTELQIEASQAAVTSMMDQQTIAGQRLPRPNRNGRKT